MRSIHCTANHRRWRRCERLRSPSPVRRRTVTPQNLRNRAIRYTRDFFAARRIIEVMTPKAVHSAALEPYIDAVGLTTRQSTGNFYLATSPEFALKKIYAAELAANTEARGIYEIAPVFRDDRPGKNHALEFTMVEWYAAETSLDDILRSAAALIGELAKNTSGISLPETLEIVKISELFAAAGHAFDLSSEKKTIEKYLSLHASLPQHLNTMDAATICFNLLFDEIVVPLLRAKDHLVAATGFPEYLGALAYCENGIAERGEIFFHGLELANGYREEWRSAVARERWQRYNEIRALRGVNPHAIDDELLAILADMQGVSGVALGLERVLLSLNPGADIRQFR